MATRISAVNGAYHVLCTFLELTGDTDLFALVQIVLIADLVHQEIFVILIFYIA